MPPAIAGTTDPPGAGKAGGAEETGVPQTWQNAVPAAKLLPHFEQYIRLLLDVSDGSSVGRHPTSSRAGVVAGGGLRPVEVMPAASRQSSVAGRYRCPIAFGEKLRNLFGERAKPFHFGNNRVHADFFRTRVVHGEKQDGNLGRDPLQLGRCLTAIHAGHGEIENDQIGLVGLRHRNGLAAVRGFLKGFHRSVAGQEFPQYATDDIAVVHNQNGFGHKWTWARNKFCYGSWSAENTAMTLCYRGSNVKKR